MEKIYQIRYLPLFNKDLNNIIDYMIYTLRNETAATNFISELEKSIKQRAYNPQSYEKYKSTKKRRNTYYRIYVKNFTVFYTVRDDVMEVRRLLYSKRNFHKIV